jgi:hypothetical protein
MQGHAAGLASSGIAAANIAAESELGAAFAAPWRWIASMTRAITIR